MLNGITAETAEKENGAAGAAAAAVRPGAWKRVAPWGGGV
jgi:hypothetical protein